MMPARINQETLTVRDLRALADRLDSRGHSLVFADQPYLQADLKLAADGTVIQLLPDSLETTDPSHSNHTCTWRWWPGALR